MLKKNIYSDAIVNYITQNIVLLSNITILTNFIFRDTKNMYATKV